MKGEIIMTVYKDKKRNTYYYSVSVELKSGEKKRFMKRGFKTLREAKKAEVDFLYEFETADEENITFSEIADMYTDWYKKRRKESSYNKTESVIRIYLKTHFKNKLIKNITRRDIAVLHDKLLDKLSVASAKKAHTILSAILNYAIKMEYLKTNVAREVGNIDLREPKRMNYWQLEEFKQFISVVDRLEYKALFMLLFYGGMRKGESLALTWKDIDLDNKTININKTTMKRRVTTPKNESSVRKIQMPSHTMNLLAELKISKLSKPDYVVFGDFYDSLSDTSVNRYFDNYIKKAGVQKIRLHDLRHSHASYLINAGNDIQIVSKRLGHANTSTTLDIYAHLYPSKEKEAINQMEDDFKLAKVYKIK